MVINSLFFLLIFHFKLNQYHIHPLLSVNNIHKCASTIDATFLLHLLHIIILVHLPQIRILLFS